MRYLGKRVPGEVCCRPLAIIRATGCPARRCSRRTKGGLAAPSLDGVRHPPPEDWIDPTLRQAVRRVNVAANSNPGEMEDVSESEFDAALDVAVRVVDWAGDELRREGLSAS